MGIEKLAIMPVLPICSACKKTQITTTRSQIVRIYHWLGSCLNFALSS